MPDEDGSMKYPPDDASSTNSAARPAATAAPTQNGATMAEIFSAIDKLVNVFGFDQEIAQQAIEAVGTDVTTAYNFILDKNLAPDQGGPVVPIANCPHVQHHVCLSPRQLPSPKTALCDHYSASSNTADTTSTACNGGVDRVSTTGQAKTDVSETGTCPPGENWVCLHCGVVRCSRYINGHGVDHYEHSLSSDPGVDHAGHCVAASMADLSVWCHACRSYLKNTELDELIQKLEELKFDNVIMKTTTEPASAETRPPAVAPEEAFPVASIEDGGRGLPLHFGDAEEIDFLESKAVETTQLVTEYPFTTLPSTLQDVATFIQSDKCKSVIVLAGAGMSVSSGIPDFRSVGGLYKTLQPELLTASEIEREAIRRNPTFALEQGLFLDNPFPCLELKRPFILGTRERRWKATLAHRFVELLHTKTGKLTRLYTQNIDGLEGQCIGLPRDKVVAVHGSMDRAECARCGRSSEFGEFCDLVQQNIKDISGQDPSAPKESSFIPCLHCGYAAVKPSIVLFRANLPDEFSQRVPQDLVDADLLIIIGTSLAVAPANTLVYRVNPTALRLVVNNEPVGRRLGIQYGDDSQRDCFAQGDCESVLLDLMCHLGWIDDLESHVEHLPESSATLLRERLASRGQS